MHFKSCFIFSWIFSLTICKQLPILRDPELLHDAAGTNVMLILREDVCSNLDKIDETIYPSESEKLTAIVQMMQDETKRSQTAVVDVLEACPVNTKYTAFWITNKICVENPPPDLIKELVKLPELYEIRKEYVIPMSANTEGEAPMPEGTEWNVKQIGAEEAWHNGATGLNVIVANIDTGVNYTHEALAGNYIGTSMGGWYDPLINTTQPTDDTGHGTQCMSVLCGNNGIGVAKDAKWMACRACYNGACYEAPLYHCGQFLSCPQYPPMANPTSCWFVPHIASCSWGAPGNNPFYNDVLRVWKSCGILPIFAAGNRGPNCSTVDSPADQDYTIGVGYTTATNVVAYLSGRGPRPQDSKPKPDICAPGEGIKTADPFSSTGYSYVSGTSIAAPHVAAAAALLKSKNVDLKFDNLTDLLYTTASMTEISNSNCGGTTEYQTPNYIVGYGKVNVGAAVAKLSQQY